MKFQPRNLWNIVFCHRILLFFFATFPLSTASNPFRNWGIDVVERKVENALESIHQILNFNKNPSFAGNVPHTFEDKFTLAEHLIDIALASHFESWKLLGLFSSSSPDDDDDDSTSSQLLSQLSHNHSIIVRFSSIQACHFVTKQSHEVVVEKTIHLNLFSPTTSSRIQTITDYLWKIQVNDSLVVCTKRGGQENCTTMKSSSNTHNLTTSTNQNPCVDSISHPSSIDLDITWFLKELSSSEFPSFHINRADKHCFTPVHNRDSIAAFKYFDSFADWSEEISSSYYRLMQSNTPHEQDIDTFISGTLKSVFIPVLPIMMNPDPATIATNSSADSGRDVNSDDRDDRDDQMTKKSFQLFLTADELAQCLLEEKRTLNNALKTVELFKNERSNTNHVKRLLILRHMNEVSRYVSSGVMSIEGMLERELYSAIGHEVTVDDVEDFMKFRYQQLFLPEYRPLPMIYSVRRSPFHSLEGTISIEKVNPHMSSQSQFTPIIHTIVRRELMTSDDNLKSSNTSHLQQMIKTPLVGKMSFALNDAATITLYGERFIHSYLHQEFHQELLPSTFSLSIQSRQFCSFIVLLGTISSSSLFDPLHAILVQNKDEMKIPLEMEFIPSIKEFRKAISSLSVEQQEFAQSIRKLQLANTMFGVVVIQIKPQLERVLNLPPDSLTKEIQLTADLLKLFLDYQIPPDFLSYDLGNKDLEMDVDVKVNLKRRSVEKVREHVKDMQDLINSLKEEELLEKKREDDYHSSRHPPQSSFSLEDEGKERITFHAGSGSISGGTVQITSGFSYSDIIIESGSLSHGGVSGEVRILGGDATTEVFLEGGSSYGGNGGSVTIQSGSASLGESGELHLSAGSVSVAGGNSAGAGEGDMLFDDMMRSQSSSFLPEYERGSDSNADPIPPHNELKEEGKTEKESCTTHHQNDEYDLSSLPYHLQKQFDQEGSSHSIQPDRVLDFLTLLTRSGALPIEDAAVHVVMASSYSFPQTLLKTVIQRNKNPLRELEEVTLLMASVIHKKEVKELKQR